MAGIALTTTWEGLQETIASIQAMSPTPEILDAIGSLLVAQTQVRISQEKRKPGGEKWKPWSKRYAQTRHQGHSLLRGQGALHNSIESQVAGDRIIWGSNLVYARVHQKGYRKGGIPARTYLGLSTRNERELEEFLLDIIGEITFGPAAPRRPRVQKPAVESKRRKAVAKGRRIKERKAEAEKLTTIIGTPPTLGEAIGRLPTANDDMVTRFVKDSMK